ncbi:phosphatidylinositol glycan anchor biosynthesis class U protein-like [Corticium candelabrum]|uniref:phosphatidylinositol glycan anchor biosynthesis class U protein-like n=1 Tax=Corticium candelabrum TaxID=121492 RepID=UPI002E25AD03|nr:phosphatidylinositol glycan anchor biosynthesis class U protein-like [Corticium candelabrum]
MISLVWCGVVLALSVRIVLIEWNAHEWLGNRIEVSSPLTNWNRITEALVLLSNGVSAYDGDVVHETPLVILFFQAALRYLPFSVGYLFLMLDVCAAWGLGEITVVHQRLVLDRQRREKSKYSDGVAQVLIVEDVELPALMVFLYLINPFSVATCVGRSTTLLSTLSIILSLLCALKGRLFLSTLFTALSGYLSFYPVMLILPITMINCEVKNHSGRSRIQVTIATILSFLLWSVALFWLSYSAVGSWQFLYSVYGFILSVPDHMPNLGLFWYFFMLVFDHFREFFLWIFQINVFVYAIPLALRLRDHPTFLFYVLCFLVSIFKSFPTVGDVALPLSLLPLWSHLFKYMRYTFVASCMLLAATIIGPIFWYMWVVAGHANANFFFAATVLHSLGQILLLNDSVGSLLRRDYDLLHGISPPQVQGKPGIIRLR